MSDVNINSLIQRFENAIHEEAMAEARDASYVILQKKADATKAAKQNLTTEFERLQGRVRELETASTTTERG